MSAFNIPEAPAIPGARHLHSGKVRDLYRIEEGAAGRLLMVASDRISAYDFVLDTDHPGQGRDPDPDVAVVVRAAEDLIPNHVVDTDVPARRGSGRDLRVAGDVSRSSAWPAATSPAPGSPTTGRTGEVCGIPLPPGLQDGIRLPEPIFTPADQGRRSATTTRTSTTTPSSRPSATTTPPSCGC